MANTTKEAKHTRGPWAVDDDGMRVIADNGDVVARAAMYGPQSDTPWAHEANARLIAAAPTMLGALVEAAGALQGAAECMRRVDAPKTADKLEEIALAAMLVIARATGEQQ